MNRITSCALIAILLGCSQVRQAPDESTKDSLAVAPIALVIHGGAGTIPRGSLSPEKEQAYHDMMKAALDSGYAKLETGKPAVEAVLAAIQVLENSPLFNAGKGAVFTSEGTNELDASIMEGRTLSAGAVAGVKTIRNPILAAHAVMTKSPHVMLAGEGAEHFAAEQGLEIVPNTYFFDSARYKQFRRSIQKEDVKDSKHGTVGCVALDKFGDIAAGTSTGGMTNKKFGRIGDAPIIGAGTYANNATCGISSTGWGEFFIRLAVAHDISALIEYQRLDLNTAAEKVVVDKLGAIGGTGGVIGLTRDGQVTMTFNTDGMYRGYKRHGEPAKTFIYKDE